MIVKVTQEHIDRGRENSYNTNCIIELCPISLALKDTFKVKVVKSSSLRLMIGEFPQDDLIFTVPTPEQVAVFINNFDAQTLVKPFEFELSLEGVKL